MNKESEQAYDNIRKIVLLLSIVGIILLSSFGLVWAKDSKESHTVERIVEKKEETVETQCLNSGITVGEQGGAYIVKTIWVYCIGEKGSRHNFKSGGDVEKKSYERSLYAPTTCENVNIRDRMDVIVNIRKDLIV